MASSSGGGGLDPRGDWVRAAIVAVGVIAIISFIVAAPPFMALLQQNPTIFALPPIQGALIVACGGLMMLYAALRNGD